MNSQTTRTWAEISENALRRNVQSLRRSLPEGCALMGVVKADGYGHGAAFTARILREEGAGYLAVACPEEALALRRAGETLPILILGATDAMWAETMADNRITQSVECIEKAKELSAALPHGKKLRIHLKLDTGMGRIGFCAAEERNLAAAAEAAQLPGLETEGIFTHFSVSDTPGEEEYTREQFRLFSEGTEWIERRLGHRLMLHHCSNSGAVLSFREEGFPLDMVRPGILTYGVYPDAVTGGIPLEPVMELKSRIAAVTHHKKGDSISYGRMWKADRDCTLAVMPMGYADGLQRALSGKLEVLLRGRRVCQVGRICMDVCMLDVTDLPEVKPGDVVTVFGRGIAPNVSEVAAAAGTIPYEILCGVSPRVPRIEI